LEDKDGIIPILSMSLWEKIALAALKRLPAPGQKEYGELFILFYNKKFPIHQDCNRFFVERRERIVSFWLPCTCS
jgi:hypothetical protein